MISLRWADVDQAEIRFRAENVKTKEARVFPIVGPLADLLKGQPRRIACPFVFAGLRQTGVVAGSFELAFRTAARAAGLGYRTPHDLRRSFARNMDRRGMRQSVIMALMGHKTASMFNRYRIVPEEELRESIERAMGPDFVPKFVPTLRAATVRSGPSRSRKV